MKPPSGVIPFRSPTRRLSTPEIQSSEMVPTSEHASVNMGCSSFEGTEAGTCQLREGICHFGEETDALAILQPVSLTESVFARI